MPLDPDLAGRAFPPTTPYTVSREKIAEFVDAIGSETLDDGETAPLTFPILIGLQAMTALMTDPDVGIELRHVVHGEQRFEQRRPIRAGDRLTGTLTIDSLRTTSGTDLIGTRTEISTVDGEPVCTALATLVHRGGEA